MKGKAISVYHLSQKPEFTKSSGKYTCNSGENKPQQMHKNYYLK